MAQARTRSVTLDGVWSKTRLRKKLAFRMWPDLVPPSGVDASLSHLEYPSNVFGFAIDPSQPAEDQLEKCLLGAIVLVHSQSPV